MIEGWRKKLVDEIQLRGLDMKALSKKAGLGETYVRDAIKRGRGGKVANLQKIERALGKPVGWLTAEGSDAPSDHAVGFRPQITPGEELVGGRSFPVYAAAEGGDGVLLLSFDPVERVKWPSILEGVQNAYGVLVVGDSLAKAYRHGDMALVHPGLPVARDEVHIFYHTPPDREAEAIIKNLLSWTSNKWRMEQFNPQREWEEHRVDWPIAHRVVGKYGRR